MSIRNQGILLGLISLHFCSCAKTAAAGSPLENPIAADFVRSPASTVIPTDTLPLTIYKSRNAVTEDLQFRVLQRLPARVFLNGTVESSFRLETNPYQFPAKQAMTRKFALPGEFQRLSVPQQNQIRNLINKSSTNDVIYRIQPTINLGYAINESTQLFATYFLLRDADYRHHDLSTVVNSFSFGAQKDFRLSSRANIQAQFQCRELLQSKSVPIFDFLPSLTASYVLTPRTVAYINTILQLRGRKYFEAPTRELDPFYTWGILTRKGLWSLSASTTFVQNFREPFGKNAAIRIDNYSMISDFEIARSILAKYPGTQIFCRAEPIWNIHARNQPGLSGIDFRLFWGIRSSFAKPAIIGQVEKIRKQIEELETISPSADDKSG